MAESEASAASSGTPIERALAAQVYSQHCEINQLKTDIFGLRRAIKMELKAELMAELKRDVLVGARSGASPQRAEEPEGDDDVRAERNLSDTQTRTSSDVQAVNVTILRDPGLRATRPTDKAAATSSTDTLVVLERSVWSAAMLASPQSTGTVGTAWAMLLLALNLAMQAAFVLALAYAKNLSGPRYRDTDVRDLRQWRRSVAHHVDHFDALSQRSLARRVCDGDAGLLPFASHANAHGELQWYLRGDLGPVMCGVALLAWYVAITCKASVALCTAQSMHRAPLEASTRIEKDADGRHACLLSMSATRKRACLMLTMVRYASLGALLFYGTLYLVYAISLNDLLFRTVSLTTLLHVDQLLYAALALSDGKRVVNMLRTEAVSADRTWRGLDGWTAGKCAAIAIALAGAYTGTFLPQYRVLVDARDALCAGDLDFVFAVDGIGALSWAYPVANAATPSSLVGRPWRGAGQARTFSVHIIEQLLLEEGRSECPEQSCPMSNGTLRADLPACCLVQQVRTQTVEGGVFSLRAKSNELVDVSASQWNPLCVDAADGNTRHSNLIRLALGDALRDKGGNRKCTKICPPTMPVCGPDGACSQPACTDVEQFCHHDTLLGVRARQLCPQSCGCSDPRSALALSSTISGCPSTCDKTPGYLHALAELPCKDVATNDPAFVSYLSSWLAVSAAWPRDRADMATTLVRRLQRQGCGYLRLRAPPTNLTGELETLRDHGANPCVESGTWSPVRPLSSFCPIACGCRSGDSGCPDLCPR